jgi:amino acid permease
MAAESPTRSEGLRSKSEVQKESYGEAPYAYDGEGQHHIVSDKLARKLSARQVQMIAIGELLFVTW